MYEGAFRVVRLERGVASRGLFGSLLLLLADENPALLKQGQGLFVF